MAGFRLWWRLQPVQRPRWSGGTEPGRPVEGREARGRREREATGLESAWRGRPAPVRSGTALGSTCGSDMLTGGCASRTAVRPFRLPRQVQTLGDRRNFPGSPATRQMPHPHPHYRNLRPTPVTRQFQRALWVFSTLLPATMPCNVQELRRRRGITCVRGTRHTLCSGLSAAGATHLRRCTPEPRKRRRRSSFVIGRQDLGTVFSFRSRTAPSLTVGPPRRESEWPGKRGGSRRTW